jgi:hypothetical protein
VSANTELSELALDVVFDWCVPAASEGRLRQSFPASSFLELTDEERKEFGDADWDECWRIDTDKGLILYSVTRSKHQINTCDCDPKTASASFINRLKSIGARDIAVEDQDEGWKRIDGIVDVASDLIVPVIFVCEIENPVAGFFSSAWLMRKNSNA